MATVMNYKDEEILEDNNSQNNGELLKEKKNNMNNTNVFQHETLHKSSKKAASPNSQNISSELVVRKEKSDDRVNNSSNNNTQDNNSNSIQSESSHKQSAQQQVYNNGITSESTERTNESLNGLKKSPTEKKDLNQNNNGYQNQNSNGVVNFSSNLRNNVSEIGTSNGQYSNNSTLSHNQTIPLCEQESQVKMMKLAGLTVLMHRKKGEIIYRLADNMSVSSLSDAQREALLKEIKTLHDSNAIVTQSMSQPAQDQGTPMISSSSINADSANISRLSTTLSEHPSVVSHDRTRSPLQLTRPSISTSTPSMTATKSVNNSATLNTQTASKQLYIPLASRPPLVVTEHSSQSSDKSQSTIPSNMTQETLYPLSSLEDSFYSDGSSRSTRRYTKTGRYAKKRSIDETDSQSTQEYPTQYQHLSINSAIPMSAQTSQLIQPVQSPQPIQSTYYTSTTPTTRPIVQYYSASTPLSRPPISQGIKRPLQSTGIQRTTEEVNHHLDIVQRFEAATKADQMAVLQPDYKTPFRSFQDAVARLLPYHVFEYPDEDMKGNDQTSDLDATKNALRFYKRRKTIFDKYNDLLKKEAERSSSTAYTNLCERLIVDDGKTENMTLKEECRQLSEQLKTRSQLLALQQQQQLQQQLQSTQQLKRQS